MATRKINSTYSRNETCVVNCDLTFAISLIDGRWKLQILSLLGEGKMRFGEIKKNFSYITDRMLTLQLQSMERDGLIKRTVHAAVPPKVEYELTERATDLEPILEQLSKWGKDHRKLQGKFENV